MRLRTNQFPVDSTHLFPLCCPARRADETALRGRPEVYVTGGFNRWTHPGEQRQCEGSVCRLLRA